jgi:CubicO group peptidase (beta-lactamase class C family)
MGRLDMDAPVRTYLPDLRLADEATTVRLTLRHLLTHTAGWQTDYFYNPGSDSDALVKYVAGMKELPQITPVGEVWAYNSPGICLTGRVLEVVTDKTCEAAINELVLTPLDMRLSFFFAEEAIVHRVAVGHYSRGETGLMVAEAWAVPRALHPSGGLITTVNDLLRYVHFHLGTGVAADGTCLLTSASLAMMKTPQVQAGGRADAAGITWMLKDMVGGRLVRHGGGTSGQWSECLMVPERNFALILLTNAEAGDTLNTEVSRWALRHYLHIEEPELSFITLPEEKFVSYVGRYEATIATVELSLQAGELMAQVTYKSGLPTKEAPPPPLVPPVRLAFYRENRMIVVDPPIQGYRGELLRSAQGEIAWLRFNGHLYVRLS